MFERPTVVLTLLVLAVTGGVAGQQTAVPTLQQRADSLLTLWREANRYARIQQELHGAKAVSTVATIRATAVQRGMRPVQAGALMVLSDAPDAIPLQAAADRAWTVLVRTYGQSAPALATRPMRVHVIHHDRASASMPNARDVFADILVNPLMRTLLAMVGEPKPDPSLEQWLNGSVRPLLDTAATERVSYVNLVLAPSRASRLCFAGDLGGCRRALQLGDDTTFFLSAYDAADRRVVVAGARSPSILEPLDRAIYDRCTVDQVDSACVDFLRSLGRGQIPRPLSDQSRGLFLSSVLDLGGPAAYDRLVADPRAPIADRVAAAAGMPLDSAIARWRTRLIAARPPAPTVPLGDGLLALGWIGILATCAARSTRWRVA